MILLQLNTTLLYETWEWNSDLYYPGIISLIHVCSVSLVSDGWKGRWVLSDWKRAEGKAGSFKHTAGKWSGDPDDKGTVLLLFWFICLLFVYCDKTFVELLDGGTYYALAKCGNPITGSRTKCLEIQHVMPKLGVTISFVLLKGAASHLICSPFGRYPIILWCQTLCNIC